MTQSTSLCGNCNTSNRAAAKVCKACGSPLGDSPTLLKQRYQILTRIGQGGFGMIYQAEDTHFSSRPKRAVKEMLMQSRDPHEQQQAIEAFKQEALLLAGLMHEHLPRIYDYFEEGDRWYLVMDYIDGETLEDCVQTSSEGKLLFQRVLDFALQLCTALDYLHSQQPPIIFRDLKPANVMVTANDHLYLIDFGIARLFKPGQTKDTSALGSPGYAPPEQYGKAQTTERADIYSLGATLHHLLSGLDPSNNPFRFPPLDLTSHASAGPAMAKLVGRMLELDEQKRPPSAKAIRQDLQSIAQLLAVKSTLDMSNSPSSHQLYSGKSASATNMYVLPSINYPVSPPQPTIDDYVNKSKDLIDLQRYQEALAICEQALLFDPSSSMIYVNKAAALNGLGRYREALAICGQALQYDPHAARAHYSASLALCNLGDYQQALGACEQALRLDPSHASTYVNKSWALIELGRYQEALNACEQALQYDPHAAMAHHNVSVALIKLGRYQQALQACEQALRLDPGHANARINKEFLRKKLWSY